MLYRTLAAVARAVLVWALAKQRVTPAPSILAGTWEEPEWLRDAPRDIPIGLKELAERKKNWYAQHSERV